MHIEEKIRHELKKAGVDLIHCADISHLSPKHNKNFPSAIIFGISLTAGYLQKIVNTPSYIQDMVRHNEIAKDEFHMKERKTDQLADQLADFIRKKGYAAYSQSEDNIYLTGYYDQMKLSTPLPHKTIALLAGMGWIGKHNLLVTKKYGSAISMCTVLTDAPLHSEKYELAESACGNCNVCVEICPDNALQGINWKYGIHRDRLLNATSCSTCLKCLAFCPWTRRYMQEQSEC